ncbi:MAG: hypothetical protein P8X42_07465 [Calditrichaceae bacterium]
MKRFLVFLALPLLIFAQDHLLISEVMVPQSGNEQAAFVEIFNPMDEPASLNQIYLSNYNTYYKMVNEEYSSNAAHFVVRFPDIELAADEALVVAVNGAGFYNYYGKRADYEIAGMDVNTPDLIELNTGANPAFSFVNGMIVLFNWDGNSDRIKDVDYMPWGILSSARMDKTGISIDGPDADGTESQYNDDLAKASQIARQPSAGKSIQRAGLVEIGEISAGGNGITGHNEATENWQSSFVIADPGPGVFSENPGDGTGTVTMSPDSIIAESETDIVLNITGTAEYTLTSIEITLPDAWIWGRLNSDVDLSGSGLSGAYVEVSGNVITINDAVITNTDIGEITIINAAAPEQTGNYIFMVKTAVEDGELSEIGVLPSIYVREPIVIETITIREARQLADGSSVSVRGVVVIGIGALRDDRTDVYIQDESGYGINIFDYDLDPRLERGNEVYVQGMLTYYNDLLEITDYKLTVAGTGVSLPEPVSISTDDARSTVYDSRFVRIQGELTGTYSSGGGTNLYVDDGTGECTVRVWDSADLDLGGYETGDFVTIKGMGSIYNGAGQILLTYQEDISKAALDTARAFLKVPNKPFVPDRGEELEIEYCSGSENSHVTLRIFDLGGRLIVTLIDGSGVPFTKIKKWDGRNHIDELVPLGAYICHLEVVNEDTGKRTEKAAPIVVGTVLK